MKGAGLNSKKIFTMNQYEEFDDCDGYDAYYGGGRYSEWDTDRETFEALTDGQYGSYDDFVGNGGDLDWLSDALGF